MRKDSDSYPRNPGNPVNPGSDKHPGIPASPENPGSDSEFLPQNSRICI